MKKLPITKYLKLPFQFDEQKLLNDLMFISNEQWMPHHYTHNYNGDWNSLALYSEGGDDKNILAAQNSSTNISETQILKKCEYFKGVIHHFKCPLQSVRLLRLTPNSVIKPHKDFCLGYENNNFRLHIPITTNNQVEFILDKNRLKMLPGECWYTNVNFTHSVANNGNQDRIHLVIDGERNDWSDQLFFSLASKESFALKDEHSQDVLKMMVEELKKSNEPASKELLMSYQEKLK